MARRKKQKNFSVPEMAIKKSYFGEEVDVDSEINSLFDGKISNEIIRDFKKEN
ncbi:MAG: hypothetical protein ACYSR0_02865 [Planctomycetota bacterium]|jgi:hypothetical protein